MEAFRPVRLTCQKTLAPTVSREENEQLLRVFNAPTRGPGHENEARDGSAARRVGVLKRVHPSAIHFNPLRCIYRLTTETMSDLDAERIAYPALARVTPFEQLLEALIQKLQQTVQRVTWNCPHPRPEWSADLRFFGACWLVVRAAHQIRDAVPLQPSIIGHSSISSISSTEAEVDCAASAAAPLDLLHHVHEGKPENQYPPLLVERSVAAENQLFADVALRLGGRTFQLSLFHISGVLVSPDRMHVLVFDGFRQLCVANASSATDADVVEAEEDKDGGLLSTLSFSSCQIGSASLLVLLAGVVFLSAQHSCHVRSLDLSYNDLTATSLCCLTQTLRFTRVRRLSLRGNILKSSDPGSLRELLLEGCDREMEELDLSYTALTPAQASAMIDCLPRLVNLRVLLLEEVTIPTTKWPAFARAVEKMHLWHVRLFAGPPSSMMAGYAKAIEEMCLRNRQRAVGAAGDELSRWGATTFFGMRNSSFFEAFFHLARLRGGLAFEETTTALPDGYDVFTTNDPSLLV
ncbi:Leucine Rich repeat [Novymonas esmeraldas]|uniref:Leucine Rich repeat n=1 Tax=Novymonas esmeraldas TaxID=1808958 RepID=A0AAW0ETH4_9TRYP